MGHRLLKHPVLLIVKKKLIVDSELNLEHDLVQLSKKIKNISIEWDDEKEVQFLKDKKKAMHNFHKLALNPTYFDCGFARYTEKVLNDSDVKRLRVDSDDNLRINYFLNRLKDKY